jgi:hypothetical protein
LPEEAQHHADLANPSISRCGKMFLKTAKSLAENSPRYAWLELDSALSTYEEEVWSYYTACMYSVLQHAVSYGHGTQFREWMETANYQDRYAPLYWAFLALLEGDDILLNVSPEVRRTAERIYHGLAAGAKTKAVPKKRTRSRRNSLS